jgi:hypothetical protein
MSVASDDRIRVVRACKSDEIVVIGIVRRPRFGRGIAYRDFAVRDDGDKRIGTPF